MQEKRLRHFGGMMIKGQAFYRVASQKLILTVLTLLPTYSVNKFPFAKVPRVTPSKHEQLCLIISVDAYLS